jgi:hypothetical protein
MLTMLRRNQLRSGPRMDAADYPDKLWSFPVRTDVRGQVRICLPTRDFAAFAGEALVAWGTAGAALGRLSKANLAGQP